MTARFELPTPGAAAQIAAMFSALVPMIVTERFVLRATKLADFPAYADIACGERGAYIGGPMSREDAWFDFVTLCSGWMLHGHGGWTIEDPASFKALGFVAVGMEPGNDEIELGYLLTKAAEGKGIASETVLAIRDWAKRELGLTGLVSYIDPDNTRSANVATRLGATRDAKAEAALNDPGTHVYRHPAKGGTS